ncbi:MAG: sugar ABC transporter permease [Nocardioides sp.]|uniref:carbohydrate ABC transporter permease n=1 Tax=Nocardioides sp. TaxID=35761 RepID=UPI0039E22CC5
MTATPMATSAPAPHRETSAPMRSRPRRAWYRLAFAAPAIVLVSVFFFLPFLANAGFSFTQWTGYSDVISWNGLDNFRLMFELGVIGHATLVTVGYAVVSMAVQNGVGLVLAKALQSTNRVNTVFRSVFFVPVLMSPLAAGYIWAGVLRSNGALNAVIGWVKPGFDYAWLGHDTSALLCVATIDAWKWSGLVTLIYIAGLNRIPRTVVEAATLDGAGAWLRFWRIEFPLLAPAFTFNLVITLVGAFSALDVIFATTGGGPGNATRVLNAAVYEQYGQGLFGTASALSLVITLLVIITAVPLIAWLRRREVRM